MSEGSREPPMEQEVRTAPASNESKKKKYDYNEQLKQNFGRIFEALTLTNLQKEFLRSRWLDQVLWMEGRAARARDRYYSLRLATIICSVIVPILLGLNFSNKNVDSALKKFTIVLSGVVAVSSAVEEFFHYGERWRHYRRTAESLKAQGWQFFELSGPYYRNKTHEEAFSIFANVVEDIIQHDVEVYATQVTQEKKKEKERENQED